MCDKIRSNFFLFLLISENDKEINHKQHAYFC